MIHIYFGVIQIDQHNACRHGFALNAHSGKIFDCLEQNLSGVADVQLEFENVPMIHAICVIDQNGIIMQIIDMKIIKEIRLSMAFDIIMLFCHLNAVQSGVETDRPSLSPPANRIAVRFVIQSSVGLPACTRLFRLFFPPHLYDTFRGQQNFCTQSKRTRHHKSPDVSGALRRTNIRLNGAIGTPPSVSNTRLCMCAV